MTPKICEGFGIEQYNAEQAIASLAAAPSELAAQAIFRLLREDVKAQLRRVVHKVAGERAAPFGWTHAETDTPQ